MFFNVPDPIFDIFEGFFVGDVVDQHDSHRAPVVGRCDRSESFLAGRVPDLQLDLLTVQFYRSNFEINS